jgi:hypothetical protein
MIMPHYANRLGKATDDAGLGLFRDPAVISELKNGASAQSGLNAKALIRDIDKLSLLLSEFKVKHPADEAPLASVCIWTTTAARSSLRTGSVSTARPRLPVVKLPIASTEVRPPISPDRLITR